MFSRSPHSLLYVTLSGQFTQMSKVKMAVVVLRPHPRLKFTAPGQHHRLLLKSSCGWELGR